VTGRRAKLLLILAGVVAAAVVLGAWTQDWFSITIDTGQMLPVPGSIAAPALTALALSELVLLGAIAIAGPFFRIVLAIIEVFVGVAIGFSALVAILDPVSASSSTISTATGVAGDKSIAELVTAQSVTAWPWVALVGGVLVILLAIAMLVTARSWPGSSSRKYQTTRMEPVDRVAKPRERSAVDDWDALSGGDDPTT
jgi:uncharacterized membrane protein (TIGR02234 family)